MLFFWLLAADKNGDFVRYRDKSVAMIEAAAATVTAEDIHTLERIKRKRKTECSSKKKDLVTSSKEVQL